MQNKFFGSKLNTILLFVLIILMVIAIRIIIQSKETYLPFLSQNSTEEKTYLNKYFSIKYPVDLTYAEQTDAQGKIEHIVFYDGKNSQSQINIVDPNTFEKSLYNSKNEAREATWFMDNQPLGLTDIQIFGENSYKVYEEAVTMHPEPIYYIKRRDVGLSISNTTYFGAQGPNPSFRDIYIDFSSLKFK